MRLTYDDEMIAALDQKPPCLCRAAMRLVNAAHGLQYFCESCGATRPAYNDGAMVGRPIPLVNPRLLAARLAIKEIVGALDLEGCEKVLKYARKQIRS